MHAPAHSRRDAADGPPGAAGADGGERITRLFPKCRPKMQHHGDRLNSGLEGRSDHLSSDEGCDDGGPLVILNSKGGSYKLRDSRIIEIAGGRELYSASRTKAARKLRHGSTYKHNLRNKARCVKETADYAADNLNTEISLHRLTGEPKKMISRHTSPTYMNGDALDSLAIPRNSSPILDPHKVADPHKVIDPHKVADLSAKGVDLSAKGSPIAVLADGEVVVLDDNQEWKGLRVDADSDSDERALDNTYGDCNQNGGRDASPRVRVIGELPIAQYEGSPRRYGLGAGAGVGAGTGAGAGAGAGAGPQTNGARSRSPRPGFPQRVTESRSASPPVGSAFDYLYEFSETRKVLEEFFKCPTADQAAEDIVHFQDLDYELRRQPAGSDAADSEADWPRAAPAPDSPHSPNNHTDFLGLQEGSLELVAGDGPIRISTLQSLQTITALPEPVDVSGLGAAALSAALSARAALASPSPPRQPRAPAECALAFMEKELKAALQQEAEEWPAVEDGLSSGHASDSDNNNRLALQNHSSLVIEEVVDGADLALTDADLHSLDPLACSEVPPPAPAPHRPASPDGYTPNRKRPPSAQSNDSADNKAISGDEDEADTDLETDRLLGQQRTDDQGFFDDKGWRKPKSRTVLPPGSAGSAREPPRDDAADDDVANKDKDGKKKSKNKEDINRSVLIEGVLFRARYLGSTQLACEGQPTKATRMLQAEEAVSRIKAPEGENQPSTEVDLFISTEKIMVLNTELKEIMMDHALRTISYIADIGDLVVLMARRRFVPHETDSDQPKLNRTPKMICHVFESEEAQFIAQSIGQAFQVAYMEFLKANGIEDHSFVKEMDYQEVLNSQEIFGDELQMFAKKELQKEVVVPKAKGEILGVVVVESGWGSMLPTVVIANLAPAGAAARCGQLNIGDQIIAINGVSLVGLPLAVCQAYIKNSKTQTVVKLTVVPCAPVVEVKIKRPDTKYQLGFSVQNGVICSLLRGGIAERGGVRVGHRIIEINAQSVVAVPHERIVNLLATSVGEILMKTMPTSMFRLLTGQENPVFI